MRLSASGVIPVQAPQQIEMTWTLSGSSDGHPFSKIVKSLSARAYGALHGSKEIVSSLLHDRGSVSPSSAFFQKSSGTGGK